MVSQILGLTTFIVIVLAGAGGAIVKYTLNGYASANVHNRINDKKMEEALTQSHLVNSKEEKELDALEKTARELVTEDQNSNKGGMNTSHVMA